MVEENAKTESEILKTISDKLAELEDLQLVNKLDIINVKNELDRTSLSEGHAIDDSDRMSDLKTLVDKSENIKKAEKMLGELQKLKDEMGKKKAPVPEGGTDISGFLEELKVLRGKISSIENAPARSQVAGKAEGPDKKELEDLKKRIIMLENRKPAGTVTEVPDDIRGELESLKEKIAGIRSVPDKDAPAPNDIIQKIGKIEDISAEIEDIRKDIDEQKGVISRIGTPKAQVTKAEIPDELVDRLRMLEAAVGGEEHFKPPKPAPAKLPKELISRLEMVEEKLGTLSEAKPEKDMAPAGPPKEILEKIGRLEEKISTLESIKQKTGKDETDTRLDEFSAEIKEKLKEMDNVVKKLTLLKEGDKPGKKGKKAYDVSGDVEELKSMIESIRTSVDEQGKDIIDLKTDKGGAAMLEKFDGLKKDLEAMRSQTASIEKDAARVGMAPDALEELKKFKGKFPVEEVHSLKGRVQKLDEKLGTLAALAEGLKPIEIPEGGSGKGRVDKNIEIRLSELEKLVGDGVGLDKFRGLEKKMEELREWLPEYIRNDMKHKLDDFNVEVKRKVKEMEDLKEEIVENVIEQLLAQPGTISKLLGDRIKNQIENLDRNVAKMENILKPAEAKVTTTMRQSESVHKEVERLRDAIKVIDKKFSNESESLGIDLKALNTKIDSFGSAMKGVEDSGVSGVTRDIEILKTKADWLESTIHKLDLKDIHERIDGIEQMVRNSRGYSPIVLE